MSRITVTGQPGQKPIRPHLNREELDVVAHNFHPSYSMKWEDCGAGWPGHKVRPYLQNNQSKKRCVIQAEEHLTSKHEALSSKP
jgi:hypothetical protein